MSGILLITSGEYSGYGIVKATTASIEEVKAVLLRYSDAMSKFNATGEGEYPDLNDFVKDLPSADVREVWVTGYTCDDIAASITVKGVGL